MSAHDSDNYSVGSTAQGDRKTGGLSGLFHRAQERIPALSAVGPQFRQQAARLNPSQHAETLKLQLAVKAYGSVVQDYQALARENQLFAKLLYEWSMDDEPDIVNIGDRLAFLQFKQSELELDAAAKMEQARSLVKDIRNFENDLVPRRRNATNISTKIATLRKENKKNSEEQIAKLSTELSQLEQENATFEASFSTLKRTKLHEAFSLQFAAQQELGEKSAIVARYGQLLLQGMETDGVGAAYNGHDRTARVKAELEDALKNWSPAQPARLQETSGSSFLSRSDTRSFGETHSSQLSQLGSPSIAPQPAFSSTDASTIPAAHGRVVPPIPPHPPMQQQESYLPPLPSREEVAAPCGASLHRPSSHSSSTSTGGIDPSLPINLSPTARPPISDILATSPPREMPVPAPPPGVDPSHPAGIAPPEPTVAETGGVKLGTGGPSSGVLRPRGKSLIAQQQQEDEAKKLRAQQETFNAAGWGAGGVPGGFGSSSASSTAQGGPDEALPAYGEGDDEATRARERAEQILAEERERKQGGAAA